MSEDLHLSARATIDVSSEVGLALVIFLFAPTLLERIFKTLMTEGYFHRGRVGRARLENPRLEFLTLPIFGEFIVLAKQLLRPLRHTA